MDQPVVVLEYARDPRGRRARWRDRIFVALKAILVIVASALFGYILKPPTSHAVAFIQLSNSPNRTVPNVRAETQRMASHLSSLATLQQILQRAGRPAAPYDVAEFDSHLHIEPIPSSSLVQISFDDPSRSIAQTSVALLVAEAARNKAGYWNVAMGPTAGLPERGFAGAFHGAIAGLLVVLGYGIVMTFRAKRMRRNVVGLT